MGSIDEKTVFNNFTWRLMERVGARGVALLVSIVLARLLDPSTYGSVAILIVFTTLMQVFVDSGLGNALIQKKDADDLDFSSVFFINIGICLLLYILMYILAPVIADFYHDPALTALMRVLSLTIIISGIKNVQQAYVSRELLFKRFFFSTLGGTICAAIVGISMASRGYGAWALVIQNVVNQATDTLILWITVKWRPKRMFSFSRVRHLLSYGWKLVMATLIGTAYRDFRQLLIGKRYSTADLGYYNKGLQFPETFITTLNSALVSILFSVMSRLQDDKAAIRRIVRKAVMINAYVTFPCMMGLSVCAVPFIRLVLTEKWLSCVPFLRIFCAEYALSLFNTSNQNAYQSIGRTDIYLRNAIIVQLTGLALLILGLPFGVHAIAASSLAAAVIGAYVYSWSNRKLIGYGFAQQVKDILPTFILTCLMGAVVYGVGLLRMGDLATLVIQIIVGVVFYIAGSAVMRLEAYGYLMGLAMSYIASKGRKAH